MKEEQKISIFANLQSCNSKAVGLEEIVRMTRYDSILVQKTAGNRRWLCFKVKSIDDPRAWAIDYQQLYAQLRDEFYSGFRYWFDYEDEHRVECINQPFRVESDEEQLIRMRLRPPHGIEPVKLMNAAMVCQLLNGGHVGYPLSSRKVSVAMVKLGFETVHTRQATCSVCLRLRTTRYSRAWHPMHTRQNMRLPRNQSNPLSH